MSRHKKHRHLRWRSLFLWHRWLGISCALFMVLLAATGLLLNHTGDLRLDSRYVQAGILLDWYGIRAPAATGYAVGDDRITQLGDRLYLNDRFLLQDPAALLGALPLDGALLVALQQTLLLISHDGQLIEKLGGNEEVPAGMRRIGLTRGGTLVIEATQGYYLTDSSFLDWQERDSVDDITWARTGAPPAALLETLQREYRGTGLSVERIVLDLHSGRILGAWGRYLMDIVAIALLLLAILGVWVWASRKKK